MKYTHTCIKPGCGKKYQTDDPDPYYCAEDAAEAKRIAAELDAKRPKTDPADRPLSGFALYEEAAAHGVRGFAHAKDIL